jgi:hypothetical protein
MGIVSAFLEIDTVSFCVSERVSNDVVRNAFLDSDVI